MKITWTKYVGAPVIVQCTRVISDAMLCFCSDDSLPLGAVTVYAGIAISSTGNVKQIRAPRRAGEDADGPQYPSAHLQVWFGYSTFQLPDFPPCFSITRMSYITMPRSMALHMS